MPTTTYRAYTEAGKEITGSLEILRGSAELFGFTKKDDGTFDPEYRGQTTIWWNEQKTATRMGKRVFLDEDGNEHLENELVFVEEEL